MVSVLASGAVDRGFEPRSNQTKDYKIGICCFSAKHAALRRKRGCSAGTSVRNPLNSEVPLNLSHKHFILIFHIFGGYFQLFLVYLDIFSGYSAAQEIKHLWKFTSVLLDPKSSILRELSVCPRILKAVLFRLAKFLLEALERAKRLVGSESG
jgi:hypothetical protein